MKEQDQRLKCYGKYRPGSALKKRTAACSPLTLTGSEQTAVNANLAAGNSLKHTSRLLLNQTSAIFRSHEHSTDDKKRRFSAQQSKKDTKFWREFNWDTGRHWCIGKQNPLGKDTEAECSQEVAFDTLFTREQECLVSPGALGHGGMPSLCLISLLS